MKSSILEYIYWILCSLWLSETLWRLAEAAEIQVIKLSQYFKKSTSTSLQLGSEQASKPTEREDIKDLKRNLTDMTKENACLALPCQTYMYEELYVAVS